MPLSLVEADAALTVFVVDDEERVREILSRKLKQSGFAVRCFESSGVATVAIMQAGLERQPVDVVLLDMFLNPGVSSTRDADTLLDAMTRRRPSPEVVVMSGVLSPEEFHELMMQGAADYIAKPFEWAQVFRRLHERGAVGRQRYVHHYFPGSVRAQAPRDAFLSYSSRNEKLALGVRRVLERMDVSTWYAPADMAFGEHWPDRLDAAIHECPVFLALLTPEAIESEQVMNEVRKAVVRRNSEPDRFLLIPIAHTLSPARLPDQLRSLQAVDLSGPAGLVGSAMLLADQVIQFVGRRGDRGQSERRRADRRAFDRRTIRPS